MLLRDWVPPRSVCSWQSPISDPDLAITVYHESSHCLFAKACGYDPYTVNVLTNVSLDKKGDFRFRGRFPTAADDIQLMAIYLAGKYTESMWFGGDPLWVLCDSAWTSSVEDITKATAITGDPMKWEYLELCLKRYLRQKKHRIALARLARALYLERSITGDRISTLLGSVGDFVDYTVREPAK